MPQPNTSKNSIAYRLCEQTLKDDTAAACFYVLAKAKIVSIPFIEKQISEKRPLPRDRGNLHYTMNWLKSLELCEKINPKNWSELAANFKKYNVPPGIVTDLTGNYANSGHVKRTSFWCYEVKPGDEMILEVLFRAAEARKGW